jgi:hypothetical protein
LIALTVTFLDVGCGTNCGKRKGINWVVTRVKRNLVFFRVKEFVYCGHLWGDVLFSDWYVREWGRMLFFKSSSRRRRKTTAGEEEDDENSRWMWWN